MRTLSGMLLVDKPPGPTSHDLVQRIRRSAGIRRVGHAGTLDPFASGLLLILLGASTRLSEYLLGLDKVYEATARLGVETDTLDLEGEVVAESPWPEGLGEAGVRGAMESLLGVQYQLPPVYSAKKVRGESAHRRARRGEPVELNPAEVEVMEMDLLSLRLPELRFRVRCSSGTYVRALARDLGRAMGTRAHLTGLRRTWIGEHSVEQARPPEALEGRSEVAGALILPALAVGHLSAVEVDAEGEERIRQGRFLSLESEVVAEGEPLRVLRNGTLLAVGYRQGPELRPRKVLPRD